MASRRRDGDGTTVWRAEHEAVETVERDEVQPGESVYGSESGEAARGRKYRSSGGRPAGDDQGVFIGADPARGHGDPDEPD
jgi:hypothetical protein